MSRLNAKYARDIMLAKQDRFDKTLATIRTMVDSSIKEAAKLGRRSVTVNVPCSVFGHEPYNLAEMGKALADQLFADDYQVSGTYSKMLISWADPPVSEKKSYSAVIKVPRPQKK